MIREALRKYLGVTTPTPTAQRNYLESQNMTRLLNDWALTSTRADYELRWSLAVARNRARDLVDKQDYAKKFVTLAQMNVVGANGFKLQVRSRDANQNLDKFANDLIERKFTDWMKKRNCTMDERLSFRQLQQLMVLGLTRDGEVFVRKIYDNSKYGFRLQLIEPELIDENYNTVLEGGNVVVMGVELDKWRKPVAYYMIDQDARQTLTASAPIAARHLRITADKMYHIFLQERAFQTRGISWFVQSIVRMRMLQGYEEASLINARVSAAKMGWFVNKGDASAQYQGDVKIDNQSYMNVSPGAFEQLPAGLEFQPFTPEFPTAQYKDYVKSILRGIASGLGVSYNSLANDMESVNYSSARIAALDEREVWMNIQSFFIESFLDDLYSDWLEMALTTQNVPLPLSKFDKFNVAEWFGRRWMWIDPQSDANGAKVAIQQGLKTRTEILAEQGKDFEDTVEQIAREKQILDSYGLSTDQEGNIVNESDEEDTSDAEDEPKGEAQ